MVIIMTPVEYEQLQDRLRKKLEYCNDLYGKRKEGFKEGIQVAMSILHSVKPKKENLNEEDKNEIK